MRKREGGGAPSIGTFVRWIHFHASALIHFHEVDKGGHFVQSEQPQLFAEEITSGALWAAR
jgi:pimeloyl-ACP methyl ester carboxylesterase